MRNGWPSFVAMLALACAPTEAPVAPPAPPAEPLPSALPPVTPAPSAAVDMPPPKTVTPSGLEIEVLREGAGDEARPGRRVSVHYVGTLTDGTEFDASRKHGRPFEFELGAGHVIKGWDEGVAGMRVGERRRLRIPPDLGYGARGAGGKIPPNATLVFEIELLGVK